MLFVHWRGQVVFASDKAVANVYLHYNKGTQWILLKKGMAL
jgi:hypothetical protein